MQRIGDVYTCTSGLLQSRIKESFDKASPIYKIYGQKELNEDLMGIENEEMNGKEIRTDMDIRLTYEGQILISTISGKAAIVDSIHSQYAWTQNYVELIAKKTNSINKWYMTYLFNEHPFIRKQIRQSQQGSQVIRYSTQLIKQLRLPKLPALSIQARIGDIYRKENKIQALRHRVADNRYRVQLAKLERIGK